MSQDITISQNCAQVCVERHKLDKNHKTMDLKRFKHRLSQFLAQDDEEWFEAFSKLQEIEQALQQFKQNLQEKIREKRLMYTLNYDTEGKFYHIFQLASQDQYQQLTCEDAALIENRVNKGRQHKESEIKAIIKETFKEAADKLKSVVDKVALRNDSKPPEKILEKKEPKREEKIVKNQQKREDVRRVANEKIQNNEFPTLKVNQVASVDTRFNITFKVLSIKKIFSIGEGARKRVLVEGGDETGMAAFVVDPLGFVKEGKVIHIKNAKVFHFHGERQIQQDTKQPSSIQELTGVRMEVSDSYHFTQRRRRRREDYEEKRPERSSRNDQSSQNDTHSNRPRKNHYEPKNRPLRVNGEERPRTTRVNREDRQQYRKRQDSDQEQEKSERRPQVRNKGVAKVERRRPSSSESINSDSSQPEEPVVRKEEKKIEKKQEGQLKKKRPTKIKDLEPGDEDLNIVAEIIETVQDSDLVGSNMLFCTIGDETGVVWAELPQYHPDIKTNVTLFLKSVEAAVHESEHKLIIRLGKQSSLEKTTIKMSGINIEVNMSEADWIEEEDDEQDATNFSSNVQTSNIVQDF